MTQVSERWLQAAATGGVSPVTTVTAKPAGFGVPVELSVEACSISKSLDSGARLQASIAVVRQPNQDTWGLVTAPGTIFTIEHGWNYGAGQREILPFGRFELAAQPRSSRTQTVSLSLMDQWKRLEECRLLSPVTGALGQSRTELVAGQVSAAIPDVTIRDLGANGGTIGTATTWDRERTTLVNDLAVDGSFQAYFAGDGAFELSPMPDIEALPAASFTDGPRTTILDLSTEVVYARLYNAVRVIPTAEQSWPAVTVQISDPTHPRHPDKIGLRPYFVSSPTLGSSAQAKEVGRSALQRIISTLQRVEVDTWARGDLEPGQTFETAQMASWTDAALTGRWLIETVDFDCLSLDTKITGRSAADVPTEEEG